MADGAEIAPTSQCQDNSLTAGFNESLQGLQPLPAPGVSDCSGDIPTSSTSRRGIFRVFAGLSPGTSTVTTPHMCNTAVGQGNMSYTRDTAVLAGQGMQISDVPLISTNTRASNPSLSLLSNSASFSSETGIKMADSDNNLLESLLQQYKQTKELYNQQQNSLEKLTQAMQGLTQKVGNLGQQNAIYASDVSDVEDNFSETRSSADEISDAEISETRGEKRKTKDDFESEPRNKKLKKLKDVEAQFSKKEEFSSDVHEVVASTVNKGLSEQVDHKSLPVQELLSKYNRPGNCEYLEVPKVNKLLWTNKQTHKDLKQTDKGFQRTQNYLTKGMIPLINIMNKTLEMESEDAEELFDWSLDAFNLLAYAHRDFSAQRRRSLLPAIASRYASLCSDSEKITSPTHLFGDDKDLEKRLREIDENQKLSKSLTVLSPGAKTRQPYKQSSSWGHKDSSGRNLPSTSRDFLGKRVLTHASSLQQKSKKRDQGQKKFQRSLKH